MEGRQAGLSLPLDNEEERSLGQRFSPQASGPTSLCPSGPLNSPHLHPQATPPSNIAPKCMPRPSCLHPDLVGSGSRRSVPLCLPSAPWEEDEIRRDRVEPQSVSLSWREPVPAGAPGANGTEYEIRYYEKVSLGWKPPGSGPACLPQSQSSAIPNAAAAS